MRLNPNIKEITALKRIIVNKSIVMLESGESAMAIIQGFSLATKIIFGAGSLRELPAAGRAFGSKVLLVAGKKALLKSGIWPRLISQLNEAGFTVTEFAAVEPEPSLDTVRKGLETARQNKVDWVAGIGGGSAIDVAKTIAGLFYTPNNVEFYFRGGKIEREGLPLIAIPTTSGSGAEVTFNAVLTDPETQIKQSIRDIRLAAKVALVDPELTYSAPQTVTAYSGMDALVQAIEAYTSKGANSFTDIYAYAAIERIAANLAASFRNGRDVKARSEMAMGSLMAGIAFSNARLGAVHGMAHPVGTKSGKPHGLVCAVLLAPVMQFNMPVCLEKYARIAPVFGLPARPGKETDAAQEVIRAISALQNELGIPWRLRDLGIGEADLEAIVAESLPSGSLKANPREATPDDLLQILKEAL